ncbi:MAG: hypothetical protein ABIW03_05795 [Sphingomicrobium sp.]
MIRIRLLVAMILALAIPASAQVMQVQPMPPRPMVIVPQIPAPSAQSQTGELTFDPALDPDKARALIAKLRPQKRELREQMVVTLADLQAARTALDDVVGAGGKAVLGQCVSAELSRRSDGGGEENCTASGYTCSPVEGTCRRQCTSTTQCAGGFVCDIGAARCVVPPTSDD